MNPVEKIDRPVVLLQPPNLCKTFTRSGSIYPPLGLCQLAAVDGNGLVAVLDAEGLKMTEDQVFELLKDARPKIIGLTATSFTLDIVEHWAKFAKTINAITIVGGPHASLAPRDLLLKCPSVDYVIRGEGEVVFPELLERLLECQTADLPGVCYRNHETLVINPIILKATDFDHLPFPKVEGLPIQNYWCPDAVRRPMITMMTTRGCPHKCAFCSSPAVMGKKLRGWTVRQIVDQIEYLVEEFHIQEFSFVDDVFSIHAKKTIALCQQIVERKLDISWFCNARADQINLELAQHMKKAGCHQVYLGFESGAQQILNTIQKGTTIQKLVRGAEILKKAGINRSIGFVIGLPNETRKTVQQSIDLAKFLRPERLQFTRFIPLVGSPLADFKLQNHTFHAKSKDQIGQWIQEAYAHCSHSNWGKESW